MRAVLPVILLATALFATVACDDAPPQSAREALAALRAAVEARDGDRIFALQDAESRGAHRDRVRSLKARVARGDDLAGLLVGLDLTVEGVREASEEELLAHFMETQSIMVTDPALLAAKVVEERSEGPGAESLQLVSPDGTKVWLWFVFENDGWVLDAHRGSRY